MIIANLEKMNGVNHEQLIQELKDELNAGLKS